MNKLSTSDAFVQHLRLQGFGQFCALPALADEEIETVSAGGNNLLGLIQPQNIPLLFDPVKLLQQNGAIVGQSGAGKTTLNTLLCQALSTHDDIGVYVFNIRPEANDCLPGFKKVTLSEILPNLFSRKPWLPPQVNAFELADIIADPFLLQYSKTFLGKTYKKLYEQGISPTAKEVFQEIAKATPKSSGIDSRQLAKIKSIQELICELLGPAANYREGYKIEEHQNEKLIVEMNLGDNLIHAMIITYFLWTEYTYNIAHNNRGILRTAFFVDESRYLISQERERLASFGAPVIDSIFATVRDAGISVIAATQTGHTKAFSTNAGFKCCFNVGDSRHFHEAISAQGINRTEEEYLKRNLKIGEGVVQVIHLPKPFICKFEKPTLPAVTRERKQPARILFNMEKNDSAQKPDEKSKGQSLPRQETLLGVELVPGAMELLKTITECELVSTADAYKKAGLTAAQGNKAKQHLETNGLIISDSVRYYSGRGRNPCFLEQTKKGEEYIKHYYPSISIKKLRGRGGLVHKIHARLVAERMKEQGCMVKTEFKEADLALKKIGEQDWTAVEIINKNSRNVRRRIKENKKAGSKRTLIVTTDKESKRRYKNLALQNAEIQDIEEFLLERNSTRA